MKKSLKAIEAIKSAGFTHFKIELEANLERGYNNWDDESDCEDFIKEHISAEALSGINFMLFYNDGSVDSELTATMPIDKPEYAIELIEAFQALSEEIGGGMDVDGAGMHLTLLTSSRYPTRTSLPSVNMHNFKREVTKLLPALFLTACSGDFTRDMTYRQPRIDSYEKYSAIYTHEDTCLEYRLFETCYNRPGALYEFIGVMARTIEYYKDPSKKVESQGKSYPILNVAGVKKFIDTPEQVSVIKKQISLIKPHDTTIKALMEARGIDLTLKAPRAKYQNKIKELKLAYKEHKKAVESILTRELTEYEQDNVQYWMRELNESYDDARLRVIGGVRQLEPEQTYINNNLYNRSVQTTIAV